ncbi:exostosin domain-containing protein [Egbenema bharatensis]|uniref:exostosin domain-containing protein n=1 Tax=Egbenema bharatensis TaxID=3463334 RepID=UPI003A8A64CE
MTHYFICKPGQPPIAWFPPDPAQTIDANCAYFGKVFEVMEQHLSIQGLTVYFTWDVNALPSYGANVVAVIQGDEWCRMPQYAHRVRAVFKCYGTRPILGCDPLRHPSYLNILTALQFFRILLIRIPGVLHYWWHSLKRNSLKQVSPKQFSSTSLSAIYDIPLGYYNQIDLPIQPIAHRPDDVFFAGSVIQGDYPLWSLKRYMGTPKNLSRQQMLEQLQESAILHPDWKLKLRLTTDFNASRDSDQSSYSERMMNSKICLVPRGTSFETFRFFEALRYGCIVVTEALPDRWFYTDSPAIQINNWNELETILSNLLNHPDRLQSLHQASLNWWKDYCSETAVGQYMAQCLNQTIEVKSTQSRSNPEYLRSSP